MAKNYRASLRKSGASGKKKAPTVFPSARTPALRHNEGAPLSTSSQPCNSTALAPRSSRFPYMTYLLRAFAPMAGVAQRFYAVSVISLRSQCRPRWVLPLFLLCCALANPRLYNTQPHDVTELKLCNSAKLCENSFAKYRTLRKNPQAQYSCGLADIYFQNSRFWKCLLTF